MRRSHLGIFVILFLASSSRAYERYREAPVAQCVLSALEDLERSKSSTFEGVQRPTLARLPRLSKNDAMDTYNVGVQWFRTKWSDETVTQLRTIALGIRNGPVDQDRAATIEGQLKEMRTPLKFLRFLYTALDKSHKPPKALDELTTAIGKLREAIEHRPADEWPAIAKRVLGSIKPEQIKKMNAGIAEFKPIKPKNFRAWQEKILDWTDGTLAKGSGTGLDWHQARKNLQALLSVYQVELQKNTDDTELRATVDFLLKETELMGDEVGEHETAVVSEGLDYDRTPVPYPAEVVAEIRAFIKQIRRADLKESLDR